MGWVQVVQPDTTVEDYAGYCARFTWKVFQQQSIYHYDSAIAAWNGSQYKHAGEQPPSNVAVPIYYDWGDYGHSAAWIPGQGVLSSPGSGYGQQWFDSVEACGQYFGASYLGWTEDMAGVPVIQGSPNPPTPPPITNKGNSDMLMIHKPSGDANVWRYAIFAQGFWLEFVGQETANGFAKQIGANSVLASASFWDYCKKAAKSGVAIK